MSGVSADRSSVVFPIGCKVIQHPITITSNIIHINPSPVGVVILVTEAFKVTNLKFRTDTLQLIHG
ncbi:hypothetical protein DXF87_26970 [Enterobacter roggenkampii]|uniref:Uncharacterized protein n=1 Tax=Enterobacter roggenkampii TaxID=1812935 RepID=A0ABD7GNU1_9ENTR|nr:hypothetical protein DXF87_26970 [Enterobacter roggenkampii]